MRNASRGGEFLDYFIILKTTDERKVIFKIVTAQFRKNASNIIHDDLGEAAILVCAAGPPGAPGAVAEAGSHGMLVENPGEAPP
jgi:hypothetical protein